MYSSYISSKETARYRSQRITLAREDGCNQVWSHLEHRNTSLFVVCLNSSQNIPPKTVKKVKRNKCQPSQISQPPTQESLLYNMVPYLTLSQPVSVLAVTPHPIVVVISDSTEPCFPSPGRPRLHIHHHACQNIQLTSIVILVHRPRSSPTHTHRAICPWDRCDIFSGGWIHRHFWG